MDKLRHVPPAAETVNAMDAAEQDVPIVTKQDAVHDAAEAEYNTRL